MLVLSTAVQTSYPAAVQRFTVKWYLSTPAPVHRKATAGPQRSTAPTVSACRQWTARLEILLKSQFPLLQCALNTTHFTLNSDYLTPSRILGSAYLISNACFTMGKVVSASAAWMEASTALYMLGTPSCMTGRRPSPAMKRSDMLHYGTISMGMSTCRVMVWPAKTPLRK